MQNTAQRKITACAFDLGNTLIHDTLVTREATEKMGNWLFPAKNAGLERNPLSQPTQRLNSATVKPFISPYFWRIRIFRTNLSGITHHGHHS